MLAWRLKAADNVDEAVTQLAFRAKPSAGQGTASDRDRQACHLLGAGTASRGLQAADNVDEVVEQLAQVANVAACGQALLDVVLQASLQGSANQPANKMIGSQRSWCSQLEQWAC